MTTGRILGAVLLVAVLLMSGCGRIGALYSDSPTAEDHVRSAMVGLKENRVAADVRSDIQDAVKALPADVDAKEVTELRQKLADIESRVTDNQDELTKRKPALLADLESVAQKLTELSKKTDKPIDSSLRYWLWFGAKILGAVILGALVVTA